MQSTKVSLGDVISKVIAEMGFLQAGRRCPFDLQPYIY